MLTTTAPRFEATGCSVREDSLHSKCVAEPALLVLGPVAGAGHGAGMTDGARELRFPSPNDAGDGRFAEVDPRLVIATGLDIEHGRLAARVVL